MYCDYLIVGAGVFGATVARKLAEAGYKCVVIDKRNTVGGNCADHQECGITIHDYGAHIFHTNDLNVWEFVNRFSQFMQYQHNVKANTGKKITSLPFNMNTFYDLFGATTPEQAKRAIDKDMDAIDIDKLEGLEKRAIGLVGPTIFNELVKEYTEKQWGKSCSEIDPSVIGRLPLRFTWDNNYFNDYFQGLPLVGYSYMVQNMLEHENIQTILQCEYKQFPYAPVKKTIYCGPIDEFFDYNFGELEYRSLELSTESLPVDNFQGCPVMNYTKHDVPYTRIIEHKHFKKQHTNSTAITFEYPKKWQQGDEPYYPIKDERNMELYHKYAEYAMKERPDVIFGGRLGMYVYFDMDKAIDKALTLAEAEIWE